MSQEEIAMRYFNSNHGFGKHKDIAINLLKKTIEMLEEFDIKYFLVSGTLLGMVRHNGFIPWDDDIDLAVDGSILDKLSEMNKKYCNEIVFLLKEDIVVKTCFKNSGNIISRSKTSRRWKECLLDKNEKYRWPFIDLFVYQQYGDKINFFGKNWNIDEFFPTTVSKFYDINVTIPKNPDYFLKYNYGSDYMTKCVASSYNHQMEQYRFCNGKKFEMQLENVLKYAIDRNDTF